MSGLRLSARLYWGAIVVTALALYLLAVARGGGASGRDFALALVFAGLVTLAKSFPLRIAMRTKLTLDTAILFAAVILLDPALGMTLAGLGTLLAQVIKRNSLRQGVFNSAQSMLRVFAGAQVLALTGWHTRHVTLDRPEQLLALAAAALAMYLVDTLVVATMVALQQGLSPLRLWAQATPLSGAEEATQFAFGLLAAAVVDTRPWALPLFVLPAIATYRSLEQHVRLRQRAEEALRGSEAGLAEAQRIAHLGSWERDLATGELRWSDETYRIFGVSRETFTPSYEAFLTAVHGDDRECVVQALRDALERGKRYSIDHRVVLPNGATRIVHEQAEVVTGGDGKPARLVGTVQDVTERKLLEEQLTHQAFHDPLTALPNRALFIDRLERALAREDRRQGAVATLFLDLDRFKVVNDSLGHEAGDLLLIAVAHRLTHCIRPGDTAARLGGDEFTILLESIADASDAARIADRVIESLHAPLLIGGVEVFVTTSIGIVVGAPGAATSAGMMRDADVALYRAKARGRARYEVFDSSMNDDARARLALEADLRRATDPAALGPGRGEFVIHYQPNVELASGRVLGMEALLRWEHPTRGLLRAAEFIALAEETGLIRPLGRWVLAEACRQARAWQRAHPFGARDRSGGDQDGPGEPFLMSVNLSAREFQQPDLVAEVARVLGEFALEPGSLQLEITERVVMEDAQATIGTLRRLKELGVRLAIDDFGTGYSSLSYLKRFPVDTLKIDQIFVGRLGHDQEDTAIVQAVITLAKTLGMQVTAEGVEGSRQVAQLRDLGCDVAQGFYFAEVLSGGDGAPARSGIMVV